MGNRILLTLCCVLIAVPALATESERVQYTQFVFSLVVLLVIIAVGWQALRYNYIHRYRGKDKFRRYVLKNPLVRLLGAVVLTVVVVSSIVPSPWSDDPYAYAAVARLRKMPLNAAHAHRALTERFPFVEEHHYQYVSAFYGADSWEEKGTVDMEEEWQLDPKLYYKHLTRSTERSIHDIAHLGLGMSHYFERMYSLATHQLLKIEDTTMIYRNLFLGRAAEDMGEVAAANRYFRQEFALGGARKQAVTGISRLKFLYNRGDLEGIGEIIDFPPFEKYVPGTLKRYYYIKTASLGAYFQYTLMHWWEESTLLGILGATFGMIIWVFFLRRVDIYRRRSWWAIGGMLVLGAAFTFVALPLYDAVKYELGFNLNNEFWNDLAYCVFGIGFIEELVKLLPVLLFMQFVQRARGPMDYLIWGSLSALGFAFVENISYFDSGSVSIIHGRVLVTAVFHMFATTTVVFGLILGRYRYPKWKVPLFILFFFLAAMVHGVYDFWLINPQASAFFFFAYLVFIYTTFQYAAYINNCLNNSPVFRGKVSLNTGKLSVFLLVSLIGVLLFEYAGMGIAYGPEFANYELVRNMGMGSFLMFFVVLNLSFIDVVQGEWFVMRLWNFGNRGNYNLLLGKAVKLLPTPEQSLLNGLLPVAGEVVARIHLHEKNRYYLLELDTPLALKNHSLTHVLLRPKARGAVLEPGYEMEVAILAFRDREALIRKNKNRDDFRLLGYAIME